MANAIMINGGGEVKETFTIPESVQVVGWNGIKAQWGNYISNTSNVYMVLCNDFDYDDTMKRVVGCVGNPNHNDATTNYSGQLVVIGTWNNPVTCNSWDTYTFRQGDVFTIYRKG